VKLIGNVFLEVDKKRGLIIKWKGEEKLKVKNGDYFMIKFRDNEVIKITVGMREDINDPVEYVWLSGKILPGDGETLRCDIYSYEI